MKDDSKDFSAQDDSRRNFMRNLLFGVGTTAFGIQGLTAMAGENSFRPSAKAVRKVQRGGKLGVALVGLGSYSKGQLAPALQETKLCELKGIVTGSPEKIPKWQKKYVIPDANVFNYANFDDIANNDDIDIIYIVLPNGMHAEYTIRAAKTGKHVICEKPMATNVADARATLAACEKAKVKLLIGYRLHFEPYNREMMRLGQKEVYGSVQKIIADDGMNLGPSSWRYDKELAGGGPLQDVGIYCIQGAIYTKGKVPVSVTAEYEPVTDKEKFKEVEQGVKWQMQFADGSVADCRTSYVQSFNLLRAETPDEWFELTPAYAYGGIKGESSTAGEMKYEEVNQQALQMDDFADCIFNNKRTRVPGEMGIRDVAIIAAVYEAADTGKKVAISEEIQNAFIDKEF